MNDLEKRTMMALAGCDWLVDDDPWEEGSGSPLDQICAMERLDEAMAGLRPAYDEL